MACIYSALWYYCLHQSNKALRKTKDNKMIMNKENGYKCFYKGKSLEVYAPSIYEAQLKAAALFKAKKSWEVSVNLCELAGESVVQTADF